MISKKKTRAQGTIEYLIIIAIVVVIALVVVSMLVGFTDSSGGVAIGTQRAQIATQTIGVTETLVNPSDGNFALRLLNNSGDSLTITNVKVGDTEVNFSENLAQGGSKYFSITSEEACGEGEIIAKELIITYVSRYGVTHTERYPAEVFFDCTTYQIQQTHLANQCPECEEVNPGYYALGTGQTGCWDESGTPRACAGTGEDGDVYGASFARVWVDEGCGTGTVLDESTGLCWQKANSGSNVLWQAALDYCNNNTPGLPGSGWRLPTLGEIWMMYDYQTGSIYSVFSGGISHWSSTSQPSDPDIAFYLDSDGFIGDIYYGFKDNDYYRARCVRSE